MILIPNLSLPSFFSLTLSCHTATVELTVFSGGHVCDAWVGCHGNNSGQSVCLNEGPGVYCCQQPTGSEGDGENRRVSGGVMQGF